jgi:hypothetical protein
MLQAQGKKTGWELSREKVKNAYRESQEHIYGNEK